VFRKRQVFETARETIEFSPSGVAEVYPKTEGEIWFCHDCVPGSAGRIVGDIDAPDVAEVPPRSFVRAEALRNRPGLA
jgi:hypothetical protein